VVRGAQTLIIELLLSRTVLLLDEADVFLEERTLADLERNSLVSSISSDSASARHTNFGAVFLRALEYYDGILILTSNRVGMFDAAFSSRIQVSLHYDTLDVNSRRKIWQNFFNMVKTEVEDVDFGDILSHFDELVSHEMNGRQIRNVFTTARQLAIFKRETLGWDHVEQAIRTVTDFNKYLRKLHGHSEDQWARDERYR
jgi:SpoVK/Ycf46/Vps4 family AAA+-type ATPase